MLSKLFILGLEVNWDKVTDSYIDEIKSIRNLKKLKFEKPVTFFTGENGTGKSTLLEAIALSYGLNPEGGSRDFNFETKSTHSSLHCGMTLQKGYRYAKDSFFLRAESFYNVASKLEEYSGCEGKYLRAYGGKSLHCQSHGESFLSLIFNRFNKDSLYILDEPEAALSPQHQLSVLAEIHKLSRQGTQFIIVTHSPILLALPDADIFLFDENGIRSVPYHETDSYKITELFINHKERILKELL